MRLLLDTHALLWWWIDSPRLSARAKLAIADQSNMVLVSAVCAWEMAMKHRIGKLAEAHTALSRFNELVSADGFVHLPMNFQHAIRAGDLANEHKDPFDRMLIAQAEIEDSRLVSMDAAFATLGVRVLW